MKRGETEEHSVVPQSAAVQEVAVADVHTPVRFQNALDKVNSQNDAADILLAAGFELVNGYDNFTLVSSLASFYAKCEASPDMLVSDYFHDQTGVIVGILCWRLLGSVFSIVDDKMAEDDRVEAQRKKIEKVIYRHRKMLEALGELNDNKVKDKWALFNQRRFADLFDTLSVENLTENQLHKLYVLFRSAVGNSPTQADLETWENFINNPDAEKDNLKNRIEAGLKTKIKPRPIANKDTRFVGRVLEMIGDFIKANITGIGIVIGLSIFIASIPFFATLGFIATLPGVFFAALCVGFLYGVLRFSHQIKTRRHEKITQKLTQEKVRYKQNLTIDSLFFNNADESVDIRESVTIVEESEVNDSMKPIALNAGVSLSWKLIFNIPFILADASASGWMAIFTGLVVLTGLVGSFSLIGLSAILVPAVAASLYCVFALSKLIVSSYQDYHLEREKIQQVNNNLAIQKTQARRSVKLREVVILDQGDLLRKFIDLILANQDEDRKKKDFHLIEKLIGVKLRDAKDNNAYYAFLASKLESNAAKNDVIYKNSINLVRELSERMGHNVTDNSLSCNSQLVRKSPTLRDVFRLFVGYGFGITAPIAVGLGFAMVFVIGPAFFFAGVGMSALLCATYYISSVINDRHAARLKKYDAMLAQIDMRDRLVDIKLAEKYSTECRHQEIVERPFDVSNISSTPDHAPRLIQMQDETHSKPAVESQAKAWSVFGFLISLQCAGKSTPSSAVEVSPAVVHTI